MPDREKDKETVRLDRSPEDAAADTLKIDRSDPDKTVPTAEPVKVEGGSDDVTVPAARPVRIENDENTAPAGRALTEGTAPAAQPVRAESPSASASPAAKIERPSASRKAEKPPKPATTPWRRVLLWVSAGFLVVWAFFLLPGIVRSLKPAETVPLTIPDTELPPDPPLSEEVREALRLGREAEDAMRLADARKHYHRGLTLERKCSSCALRLAVVERRIEAFGFQALADGDRLLAEGRYEEAAKSYQKVLDLVPVEEAKFHILAKAGLADAREAAKKAGRPIP